MALKVSPGSTGPRWQIARGVVWRSGILKVVDLEGAAVDLTDATVRLYLGDSIENPPNFEALIGSGIEIVDAVKGWLQVDLSAIQTESLIEGWLVYELLVTAADGAIVLQLRGIGEVVRTLRSNLGDAVIEAGPDGLAELVDEAPELTGAVAGTEVILISDPALAPARRNKRKLKPLLDAKADVGATSDALALKAPLASPALTGAPTAPTPATSDNSTRLATTAMVKAALAELVASSPAALDTLNELAAALGNDANFAATMTASLAAKQNSIFAANDLGPGAVEQSLSSVLSPLVRAARPVVACLGDSRLAQGIQVQAEGTGLGVHSWPHGAASWLEYLTKGRVRHPLRHNLAVSGSTSADALTLVPSILALSPLPTHCLILTGTNDLGAAVAADTVLTNIYSIWAALSAGGVLPIQIADLPRAWGVSTHLAARSQYINQQLREQADSRGILFVDAADVLADISSSTGQPVAASYYDSPAIHPSPAGGFAVAKKIAALFDYVPVRTAAVVTRADIYDAVNNPSGNLCKYPFMTGSGGTTTGGATGTYADGWNGRILSGSGTMVGSVEARSDGGPGQFQKLVLTSGSGVSTYRFSLITSIVPGDGYAAGDYLWVAADIDVSPASGLEICAMYDLDSGQANQNNGSWMKSTFIGAAYYGMPAAFAGRAFNEPRLIMVSPNNFIVRFEFRINNGAATVRIGAVEVRRGLRI